MAVNKEHVKLVEEILKDKDSRFDWFLHVVEVEKRKKIQELVKNGEVVLIPYALIIGVVDDESGLLTEEGCFTVKFVEGSKALEVITANRIGDGTYNEEALKDEKIYPNGAPMTYEEAKEADKEAKE